MTIKGDVSTQADQHHLLAFGTQIRLRSLNRELRNGAYIFGIPGYKSFIEEIWTRHPVDVSAYLQDRIELSGLVMNVGLRMEGSRLDAAPIENWYAPPDPAVDARGARTRPSTRLTSPLEVVPLTEDRVSLPSHRKRCSGSRLIFADADRASLLVSVCELWHGLEYRTPESDPRRGCGQ